jgi:hypothetical protein
MSDAASRPMQVHVALVHHPVLNRHGETIATAVTNLDIHDLARTGRTFDVHTTWLVTPLEQQRSLVDRIVSHWQQGEGQTYNPIRAKAFERVKVAASIEALVAGLTEASGKRPLIVGTGAAVKDNTISYEACRQRIAETSGDLVLLFGTGWGLIDEVMDGCDLLLPGVNAVPGRDGYNHLSVRAAVAIILDRLLGNQVEDPP